MTVDIRVVAAAQLRRPVLTASVVERRPVAYDPFLAGRLVERVNGTAEDAAGRSVTWSAMVKHTAGEGLRAARRELACYRLGIAAAAPPGALSAPALLAADDADDHVELWIEPLDDVYGGDWPIARFGLAAQHIAAWDTDPGRAAHHPGFDSEDAWAERHGQPHRLAEATKILAGLRRESGADELMTVLKDDGFERTQAMIETTPRRIEQLASLPQTLLHHDLVRSNLFARSEYETAAIDWENVGRGPLGVNLAPLVVGSVRRGEAQSGDLLGLEKSVLTGYTERLPAHLAGAIHRAYRLALGLRWHVVLGTIEVWLTPGTTRIRGSRPDETRSESLRHLTALCRYLLAAS